MRSCRNLGELCNRQRNRLTCSQVGTPISASSSRHRVMPSSAAQGRSVDSFEGRSVDSGHGMVVAGSLGKDRLDVLSDASDASDGLHLVFERAQGRKSEDETRSPAVAIPTVRGQLSEAFSKAMPPSHARSAPVPVPNAVVRQRGWPIESDGFIPPHLWSEQYEQESFRRERMGCRGLSSLRARNAVLARLARVGYIDGLTETVDVTSPNRVP